MMSMDVFSHDITFIWWMSYYNPVKVLLRSEGPSGMCAKLSSVAASNNRDHAPQSLYYCLFAPHICVVLRAHPVRGESHIQRNANGEVATVCNCLRAFSIFWRTVLELPITHTTIDLQGLPYVFGDWAKCFCDSEVKNYETLPAYYSREMLVLGLSRVYTNPWWTLPQNTQ